MPRERGTGLEGVLRADGVDQLYVLGLATDYCVKFTALDAIRLGFETHLVVDGCRGVDLVAGDSDRALREVEAAGGFLVTSRELEVEELDRISA